MYQNLEVLLLLIFWKQIAVFLDSASGVPLKVLLQVLDLELNLLSCFLKGNVMSGLSFCFLCFHSWDCCFVWTARRILMKIWYRFRHHHQDHSWRGILSVSSFQSDQYWWCLLPDEDEKKTQVSWFLWEESCHWRKAHLLKKADPGRSYCCCFQCRNRNQNLNPGAMNPIYVQQNLPGCWDHERTKSVDWFQGLKSLNKHQSPFKKKKKNRDSRAGNSESSSPEKFQKKTSG